MARVGKPFGNFVWLFGILRSRSLVNIISMQNIFVKSVNQWKILFQTLSLAFYEMPNKACSGQAGFVPLNGHGSGFGLFRLWTVFSSLPLSADLCPEGGITQAARRLKSINAKGVYP